MRSYLCRGFFFSSRKHVVHNEHEKEPSNIRRNSPKVSKTVLCTLPTGNSNTKKVISMGGGASLKIHLIQGRVLKYSYSHLLSHSKAMLPKPNPLGSKHSSPSSPKISPIGNAE